MIYQLLEVRWIKAKSKRIHSQVLPSRADGYPWSMIYSSDTHGFSLQTLYKRMGNIADTTAPCLLVIRGTTFTKFFRS